MLMLTKGTALPEVNEANQRGIVYQIYCKVKDSAVGVNLASGFRWL